MKPQNVKTALGTLILSQQPVFIWGPPGVGKSDIVRQTAKEHNLELNDVRAILLDPVDLRGLPSVSNGKTTWNTPDFLPREGRGILFLDELNAAPPMVQAACYQLILDRKLGEYCVPDGWTIIAAGNRESDRAVTSRMPSALSNRFVHIDFEVDLGDWTRWALDHGIKTELIAFLRFRPNLLHDLDGKKVPRAFPSPRSWSFVSKILEQDSPKEIELELISGTVGEGAAAELMGFLRIFRNLPDPDGVLMDPENAKVPTDPGTLYALCGVLSKKVSDTTLERFFKYASRIPAEFSVLMIRDAAIRTPDIQKTRDFIQWASVNNGVLI